MSPSKSYIQCLAVVLLLTVCSIQKVSSMGCYSCDSDIDRDCLYNPSRFAVTCVPYASGMNTSLPLDSKTQDAIGERAIQYDCASAIGISTKDGGFRVVRGCSVRQVTCLTYQIVYAANYFFQVDRCQRCSYDFCNSATTF